WAILAAIIAIGVLAYFGVFSPGKYVVGQASVTGPFYVNSYSIQTTGVSLEFKNNGGQDLTISSLSISGCGTNSTEIPSLADSQIVVIVPCVLNAGDSFKGDVALSYKKSGSMLALQATGTVAGKVI
ncbi:MAG: hypothetical protein MUF61_00800, partial [archaeon]|nr:hypothetical protein [archaeon]